MLRRVGVRFAPAHGGRSRPLRRRSIGPGGLRPRARPGDRVGAIVSSLLDPSDYFNAWYRTDGPQNAIAPGDPRRPATDDILAIDPPPDCSISGTTAFMPRKQPRG